MDNYGIAHKFFYDLSGYFSKHYMNVSYKNYKFYSYGTIIGKVIEDLDGNFLLLVSENNFSNTTAKHINNLLRACPFNDYMYVPIEMYDRDIYINNLEKIICKKLDYFKNQKFSQKYNRDEYCRYYTMLCEISHRVVKVKKSVIAKYRKLYLDLQNIEKVKSIKKLQREKDLKLAEKARKEREKALKQLKNECLLIELENIVDYAKFVFSNNFTNESIESLKNTPEYGINKIREIKNKVRNFLQDTYENYSFVWIDGENFKTSKNVTVKIEDCQPLIRLYKSGKVKHGMQLNQYTILEVKKDFVKIGCHKISIENINCLIKSI